VSRTRTGHATHHHVADLPLSLSGGIRCEKASQVVKSVTGVEEVYQLRGGIHRYIERFGAGGKFHGRNFVFDERVLQPVPRIPETESLEATADDACSTPAAVKVVGKCRYSVAIACLAVSSGRVG
jgi:predicted sulfurtransferase